jgi:hypothetical protein
VPYVGVLDESNLTPGDVVRFYVTAVLACPSESIGPLSIDVEAIRKRHGYRPGDFLKWETRSRPDQVNQSSHAAAKNAVLDVLQKHRLTFLPVLVHHHVADNKPRQGLVEWTANMAIRVWEKFLAAVDDTGVCILDRRPEGDEGAYLRGVFSRTADEISGRDYSLKRTYLLGYTMEGASHLLSVLDIALGAFCYSINERRPEKAGITSMLHSRVVAAMWITKSDGRRTMLHPDGYAFLPIARKSPRVLADYAALVEHWNHLLSVPSG